MNYLKRPSRRNIIKTGFASLAAASVTVQNGHATVKPKAPGETKVVAIMGDAAHNPISQELAIRSIFSSKKNWRIIFVRSSRYFTPELISDADLLITCRYGGRDSIDWQPEPLAETCQSGEVFWSDERMDYIIDNVKNRGMGYLPIHCTVANVVRKFHDFLGISERLPHEQIQPLIVQNLNPDHPITRGIPKFFVVLDEQFGVVMKDPSATVLFHSHGVHDKCNRTAGWCLDRGNGRIVGLLPGHSQWAYRVEAYREIFWRAAHWAMKRDIQPYPGSTG